MCVCVCVRTGVCLCEGRCVSGVGWFQILTGRTWKFLATDLANMVRT